MRLVGDGVTGREDLEKEGMLRKDLVTVTEVNCLCCCEAVLALVKLWNCMMGRRKERDLLRVKERLAYIVVESVAVGAVLKQ